MRIASSVSASGWPPKSREAALSSLSIPQTSLSREPAAASSDSLSTSTTGAALCLKRRMSATATRLVRTIRLWRARGGAAANRRNKARRPCVLELTHLRAGPMLQRLDAVEHEQDAARHQCLGDRVALGGGAGRLDLHAELVERPVEKRVRGGRPLFGTLAVERPAEHACRPAVAVGLEARQPFVDQSRFARAALGDERQDVDLVVAPGFVEALKSASRPTSRS